MTLSANSPLAAGLPVDRRAERWFPDLDLSIGQTEGMFEYGTSLDYVTPFGILHITPDPEHCVKVEDRRNSIGMRHYRKKHEKMW